MKSINIYKRLIIIFSLVIGVSCHSSRKEAEQNKKVFRYNDLSGITTLDPAYTYDVASAWLIRQIYNGLIEFDDKLRILPSIAKRWEISKDGKTYTFHLRNDVFFQDNKLFKNGKGRAVAASDFVYSFNRIVDPAMASPGLWVFDKVKQNPDKTYSFIAKDDSTFVINLKEPYYAFLSILTMPYCYVVPREVVEYYKKDFRFHPVGTGAFKLTTWKENIKINLGKNENYYEFEGKNRLPYLDGISVTFVKDNQSVLFEFLKGNLDFISGNFPVFKQALLDNKNEIKPEYKDKINYITGPYLKTEFIGFNVDKNLAINKNSPFLIKEVRQAINYAIDRKQMIKHLRNGIGKPAVKGFIPGELYKSKNGIVTEYNYDPEKAKALLTKAGFPDGKGFPEITLYTTSYYRDLCEYIQKQLSDIDITLKVDVNQAATIQDMTANAKVNFFKIAWSADYPDAENFLCLFYSKNFAPKGPNFFHFSNARYDKLFELSQQEQDEQKRISYYKEMEEIVLEEAPIVILFYDELIQYTQKNIINTKTNSMNILDLRKVKKE